MFHYGSVQNMTDKAAIFLQYLAFDTQERSQKAPLLPTTTAGI